ncbi:DUF1523 family protein [Rhizobium sp. MHM7A]|uniref:DUF1523 family protein n=1 Tax=Rhizobium sp. MHM7A TaxID=2583233 RepID=UPI0011067D4C|nr:DUF1523 family protein [Rhizobium sp. MHM7A]TLX16520.1 DUF1523 family protein [Rhizobium sp. MHM7A]
MKKYILRAVLALVLLAPPALFLHFYLPRSVIVQADGTDVKRLDQDINRVGQTDVKPGANRDVFLINTSVPGSDEVVVFRNEDTGWGWPLYFKFNDSDINAVAQKFGAEKAIVKITYYGFRIQLLSMWPNVVKIERAELGDSTFPVARTLILAILFSVLGLVYWKLRGLFSRLFKKNAA